MLSSDSIFFSRKLFRLLLLPHPRCFILSLLIKFAELLRLPIKSLSSQRLDTRSFQELFSEEKNRLCRWFPENISSYFPLWKWATFLKSITDKRVIVVTHSSPCSSLVSGTEVASLKQELSTKQNETKQKELFL